VEKKKSGSNRVGLTHFQLWHPASCSADLTLIILQSHCYQATATYSNIAVKSNIWTKNVLHTSSDMHVTSSKKNWITFHNNARIGSWVYFKIYYNWSLWRFFSMIRNNKLFSCDEVVVILVEGNNEMSAMIV